MEKSWNCDFEYLWEPCTVSLINSFGSRSAGFSRSQLISIHIGYFQVMFPSNILWGHCDLDLDLWPSF